ncbi:DUF7697 family protein [Blastochloris viridis]|uniref:DUF7697 family protein n=1 Tax=Blastochloris viridis TaxID=1079 RepID=UPI0006D74D99|nr:hypothetical protein [Blastochloris viridis]ALK09000.1 hypothetical protein BVIR_1211 [Blastochloris viridis]
MNAPRTVEGIGVWDVIVKCAGQVRTTGGAVTGLDFAAVFRLADALGVDPFVLAECLPAVEAVIVSKLNEQIANR